jgi:hypothetical protein
VVGSVEQLKVLAAALALRDFTVDELSGLSGVNPRTVRSVLRRNPSLVCRVGQRSAGKSAVSAQPGRGRPSNRWRVVDGDQIRRLIDEIGTLPRFEPDRASIGAGDWREAAVAVAEDALAQVGSESDETLQERLIISARSSLFFGNGDASPEAKAPWWETEDSQFAVRARGVDALATLANLAPAQSGIAAERLTRADALRNTARHIAEAMQATPERGEETYFAPFSQILARSGEFAPLFAVCARDQEPGFPFAGDWTEVVLADFRTTKIARIMTQLWATPLVNVSSCMPIVASPIKLGFLADQIIKDMKITPRPALVFGSLHEGGLIRKTGLAGASFVPIGKHSSDRQHAIESVAALIDRFSVGR